MKEQQPVVRGEGADVIAGLTANVTLGDDGIWTYSYLISNAPESRRGIWSLTIEPVTSVLAMNGPPGWDTETAFQRSGRLNWFCTDAGPNPPEDDGNVSPSPFDIASGAHASFSFTSASPPCSEPGETVYYIQGFHPIPTATEDNVDSLLDVQPTFLENSLTGITVGPAGDPASVPERSSRDSGLDDLWPNPMTTSATIGVTLDREADVDLSIYDPAGRRVRRLISERIVAGPRLVTWDGRDDRGRPLPSGTYFYQMSLDGKVTASRRAVIVE